MPDYARLYRLLFNAVTDAVRALDRGECAGAAALLRAAQLRCEELYMDAE